MIDRFSKERFEAALPKVSEANTLWIANGFRDGEYCYLVPVNPGVLIYIRSSVAADGLAAETAKDSIRCWLASDADGSPLGSKNERWIARTKGWDRRMTETLRVLWRVGKRVGRCPRCGGPNAAFKTKKTKADGSPNENAGRWFSKCTPCNLWVRFLTDKEGNV